MNTPEPFNESRESQDDYCADCAHADACNVMLKDGEDCGDRYVTTYQAHADASVRLDIEPDDEEAADFDAQVRDCLAHWPGIQAVDLDA